MKKIFSFVVALFAITCCLSAQNPLVKPLSIDDWYVEQNEVTESGFLYDIHFTITNTTDSVLNNYAVIFKADSCKEEPSSLPMEISGLKPLETGRYILSVRPQTSRDESISGHLEDATGRAISPSIDLKMDFNPMFVVDTASVSCLFIKADTIAHKAVYIYRAFVENTSSEVMTRDIYVQCGNYIFDIPATTLKPNETKLVSTEISLPEGVFEIFAYDSRKVVISDTAYLRVPAESEFVKYEPYMINAKWKTEMVYDEYGVDSVFMGDSLHAGLQQYGIAFSAGCPSEMSIWPGKGVIGYRISTLYGKTVSCRYDQSRLLTTFQSAKDEETADLAIADLSDMGRGGDYVFDAQLDVLDFAMHDTLRLYDEPTVRYTFKSNVNIGGDLKFQAAPNTGYPYADSVRNTVYTYQYEVVYIKPHNGKAGGDTIRNWRHESQILNFNVSHYPRLAGIDIVQYSIVEPDLGEYLTIAKSNFKNHSRLIGMRVKDTVRMETKLTKDTYRAGIDTMATIHYKIDYKWPYVSKNINDSLPTVRLYVEYHDDSLALNHEDSLLIKEWRSRKTDEDFRRADSLIKVRTYKINETNDSLLIQVPEYTFLDLEGDFTFNISNLKAGVTTPINFTVNFNDMDQKNEKIKIHVKRVGTDNETIQVEDELEDGPVYDLMGRRLDPTDLKRGIYIRNGKKFLVL